MVLGDGWVDVNPEFVGAVRLKKLLAGEFEPSGVKENGLGFASSMSAGGIVKDRVDSVSMVCDDAASWSSIDERVAKRPFTRGCCCFFQDITAKLGLFGVVMRVLCDGLCVKGENVVDASSQVRCFVFRYFAGCRYVVSQAFRSNGT